MLNFKREKPFAKPPGRTHFFNPHKIPMKRISSSLLVFTLATTTAFARIGEDEKQVEARYGQPGKDFGNHGDVHEIGYVANGFMILVDFVNGVSQREGFTKPDTSPLTEQNIKDILAMSAADGTTWQETGGESGDKKWDRSDGKAAAVFPAMGKALFVQDVTFEQPK